jgi:thioredoxin 1
LSFEPFVITDANFEETIKNNKVVLIDFWAIWCGHCKPLAPIIEELAKDYVGKAVIAKLDADKNPAAVQNFQVFSMPTMIIFKNGQETQRLVGACAKKVIEAALNKQLEQV